MKILLAIDASPHAETAIDALNALGLPAGTDVTLLTVVPEHSLIGGINLDKWWAKVTDKKRFRDIQEKNANDLLKKATMRLEKAGFTVTTELYWSQPARHIVERAHVNQADLLVIGAKGAGDSRYFPIGSIARKVTKYASCSVLLTRNLPKIFNRVVLAVDGSKHSEEAVRFLMGLRLVQSTKFFTVSALYSRAPSYLEIPQLGFETNDNTIFEIQVSEEIEAHRLLDGITDKFIERGYDASSFIRHGEPAEEILDTAKMVGADLIVMGARGVNPFDDYLMGSVAHKVTRYSPSSVLLVRPQKA